MDEEAYNVLDRLDDRSGRLPSQQQYTRHQPQFKRPAQSMPPRDQYRAPRHEPRFDRVEDDEQYGQDVPFDSFDERLVRQPYEDQQRQAAKGQARLSFPPQSSKFFETGVSSQPQSSYRAHDDVAYDISGQRDFLGQQPRLARYAYNGVQPQESSSDTQLGAPSSPAFLASQRRSGNASFIASQPTGRLHSGEEESSFRSRQVHKEALRIRPQVSFPATAPKSVPRSDVPICQGIPLVLITELPDRLRTIFPYPNFNAVQSKCFDSVYRSDNNFVLASPTGSGKTVILELAVCRAVTTNTTGQYKIVYQAPTKALCSERQRDWQRKFSQVGLNCVELTGDSDATDLRNVQSADVIVTTPEKWDSITRKWKDHEKLMRLIKLFLIDEVHILKESRGATLEVVVSRMKSIATDVRFVALSATVPNFADVATWLGKNAAEPYEPAASEKFGEEFRPVRLQKYVCGYQYTSSNDFAFDKFLDNQLPGVIKRFSEGKSIMVFCFTRKSTVATAEALSSWWKGQHPNERAWNKPSKPAPFGDRELRDCASSGVAFHHAGIDMNDRLAVEKAFLEGEISVICCTSTLAVGVNLPCHLVIIKNTVTFTSDMVVQEYADLEVMQMLGRAGRPQFDNSAVAVVMTRQSKVAKYENMATGQDILESTLHLNLIDHMNAEIGLGTIRDLLSARRWLTSTFLYVRLKQKPAHYKLDGARSGQSIDEQLDNICFRDITLLRDNNLATGQEYLRCTEFGHAMARYCIQFHSMRILMGLQPKASISEILSAIAQASEVESIRFRAGEKPLYKAINKSPYIRFPIPVNLDLPAHKVSLLVQSVLGAADITWDAETSKHKVQYNMEASAIFKHITRLIRCIIDCQICLGDSVSINNALMLERSFAARVWDDSPLQMKQIEGIGVVGVRKLANAGVRSIEELDCTDAHRIEAILGRNPPFGMRTLEKLRGFPKLRVSLHAQPSPIMKTPEGVKLHVKADIGFINEKTLELFNSRAVYVCLLAETSDGRKIHFARTSAKNIGGGQTLVFPAILTAPNLSINCYISCDGIAGTTRSASVTPKIASSMFPVPRPSQSTTPHEPPRPTSNMSRRRTESGLSTGKSTAKTDEFGDDDIDDEELVKAVLHDLDFDHIDNYANPTDNITRKNTAKNATTMNKSGVKLAIHGPYKAEHEPNQLENGRWACNHACKDKLACKHICCKDGMDRPPKKAGAKRVTSNESRSQSAAKAPEEKGKKTQTKLQLAASKRKSSTAIEELDLTQQDRKKKADYAINGPKDCRDLQKLHKSVLKKDPPTYVPSAMHQKPAYCYSQGGNPTLSFLGIDTDSARLGSISSDYGDIQFEDLTRDLQQPGPSHARRTAGRSQNNMVLDNVKGSSIESIALDRQSDTFGDDESIFEDAMVGLVDSEELRAAGEVSDSHARALKDRPDEDYDYVLTDEDFAVTDAATPVNQELSARALGFPTSSTVNVLSMPPEKGRSLFVNGTSSPNHATTTLKPIASLGNSHVLSELRRAKNGLALSRRSSEQKAAPNKLRDSSYAESIIPKAQENVQPPEEKLVPEAYKGLETWLLKEFGDIVELVD
ncbi:ATP-dependent DNA helicase MER3 [Lentithecium fluviatile CBS 122367]|uniref:DNA 3'-5' helicase n=1 Tax=Lentithecium fluviatile CBS 122367 TaxID=1168545 RepID=A0A6G1JI90_9PLEO|nr:ATP-dependent DNA helicase MER3 [Lentithecium fluviatile CBS 122367]